MVGTGVGVVLVWDGLMTVSTLTTHFPEIIRGAKLMPEIRWSYQVITVL